MPTTTTWPWYGKVKRNKKKRERRQIQGEAVNETETGVDTPKHNDEAEKKDIVEDANADDVPSRKRVLFNDFEARFGNIGYVMDITNDPDVISKVIEIMTNPAICSQ